MLLTTRKLILDREFLVDRCEEIACLTEILSRHSLDLVLLCQSVPDKECEEVIEMVRAASPEAKVLVLQAGHPASCSLHSDAAMEGLDGPPALLHEIHALLGMASGQSAPAHG
jgi:DNA-binding NarL/FixJ family response regulator